MDNAIRPTGYCDHTHPGIQAVASALGDGEEDPVAIFPERIHIELITKVHRLIPDSARVPVLRDGEFDGVDFQALVKGSGWEFCARARLQH